MNILRIILLIVVGVFTVDTSFGKYDNVFLITFSENDFSYMTDSNGQLEIGCNLNSSYPCSSSPGLPLISKSFAISGGKVLKSFSVDISKSLVKNGVAVARAPIAVPTSLASMANDLDNYNVKYTDAVYPANNCTFAGTAEWRELSVLNFVISPYIYETESKSLYFINKMTINIETEETENNCELPLTDNILSIVKNMVSNADQVDMILSSNKNNKPQYAPVADDNKLDYVIITNEMLKEAFQELTNWKSIKGVKSDIMTIEEIGKKYQGATIQAKIKNCLCDLFLNRGLKYVLLGGDDTVVPVQGCYATIKGQPTELSMDIDENYYTDKTIPSDLYYACFNGNFEWNGNNNELYGELSDNINLTPYIFVTRVPVRSPRHARNYISKLIAYERTPMWNNTMLMGGMMIGFEINGQSDSELFGDRLYIEFIQPYWNGKKYKFYDTYTDLGNGKEYKFTSSNIHEQLSKGYSFIDINTHGQQQAWLCIKDNNAVAYYVKDAKNLINNGHSIIITASCHTNAFDSSSKPGIADPCLSECFIRNPDSGIIGYVGSSRYGWGPPKNEIKYGSSLEYETQIYKAIFAGVDEENHFGEIIATAKMGRIPFSIENNPDRWLQFSLNPVGDPEMPVYTRIPVSFSDIKFKFDDIGFSLDTGLDNCKICLSYPENGKQKILGIYEKQKKISGIGLPADCTICVTKQNYIPYIISVRQLQNCNLTGINEIQADIVRLGSDIISGEASGVVKILDGQTTINARQVDLMPGTEIKAGAEFIITTKK
jgi:hypothetical protein